MKPGSEERLQRALAELDAWESEPDSEWEKTEEGDPDAEPSTEPRRT
jgi:hypothetical protein